MDFDEAISLLEREIQAKKTLEQKHKTRGMDIAEQRERREIEGLKVAIKFFARTRREQKRLDSESGVAL